MTFFIKQGDTLPELKFQLTQRLMSKYDITDEMMENVGITFSMIDKHSGNYRVANLAGGLRINEDYDNLDDPKYELIYNFSTRDTRKPGEYLGEFKLSFLGEYCGNITFPVTNQIPIMVTKGITKTTIRTKPQTVTNLDIFDDTFDNTFQ